MNSLSRSLEVGCVGKEKREVKCWMELTGRVYPCLLEVAAEKVVEVRLPSWSELSLGWRISMGGKNWLWEPILLQLCLLVKEKRTVFRAIGCVSTFRQRRMSNEDFINTSFKSELLALSVCQKAHYKSKRKAVFGSGRCSLAGFSYYCEMLLFTLVILMAWLPQIGDAQVRNGVEKRRNCK